MKKNILLVAIMIMVISLTGCSYVETATHQNISDTIEVTETLTANQQTPTDINYSLERYNLIKRAYWVNGQHEKAMAVPCNVDRPIGYITLFTGSTMIATYTVDGKITSLNSYLSPDSQYYELNGGSSTIHKNQWLADVDGSYGTNVDGIFWFDVDGVYHEWTGDYLYSDVMFSVDAPVVNYILTE